MDYLRTLGSAAATSLLQKSGITLPFSLGNKVSYLEGKGIWTLYDAIKRDDSALVSVFVFDASLPNRRNLLPLAKNTLRKLRTIRHPDVLKFIDVVETETTIHIVTERVQPLGAVLSSWAGKSASSREEWLLWGLHRIAIALAFVNDSCQSTHGNVRIDSVFISPSGEWKLGGFELLTNPKDEAAVLYTFGSLLPDLAAYSPPEIKASGWSTAKDADPGAPDAYQLGLLIHCVFNPTHPLPPTTFPPHPVPTPATRGAIPTSVFPSFKRLLTPKPKTRLLPKAFFQIGMGERAADGSGFFSQNKLVKISSSLEGFNVSSESEKAAFLRTLKESAESFPPEFTSHKVLPSLVSALDFGGASAATILPLVLQLGKIVAPADYATVILGPVVKLFASPDRGTRMALLDHLPEFADKLDQKLVSDKIWPHLQTGFSDTVAVIREATIRSISLISPKLSDRALNNELLRHLAKAQLDSEASIRTNTCILIGRLAPTLATSTQRKVLVPAFSRALKDGFVHARVAGLMALMATITCYEPDDLAGKVIPSMSFALVDKEKLVRDQAFKAMELFMKRLEAHVATMPETVIPPGSPQPGSTSYVSGQANLVNSAAGAAGALAGWAMSSLGKSLATSDMQTTMAEPSRPSISPLKNGNTLSSVNPAPALSAPSLLTVGSPTAASSGAPKAKGLQLGANKQPHKVSQISSLAEELEKEAAAEVGDAWGNESGDLMDVNADEDDWTAFESAPTAVEVDDAWGDSLDAEPAPIPVTPRVISPRPPPNPQATSPAPRTRHKSPPPVNTASRPSPAPSSAPSLPGGWDDFPADGSLSPSAASTTPGAGAVTSLTGMTKEEKAAEMARRREERKQRIAALKEQKKGKAP